jgi:hypothetical protein
MKKSEIKRRKRVVPMTGNTIEHIPHNDAASDVDVSMASSVYSGQDRTSPSDSEPYSRPAAGLPIPVDFTGSFRNPRPAPRSQDDQSYSQDGSSSARKRSFSATAEESHSHNHNRHDNNGNNNETSYPHPQDVVMHDAPVDNTTARGESELSIRALLSPDTTITPSKETRRLELRREAEKMRQALLEKERELAELGEEG